MGRCHIDRQQTTDSDDGDGDDVDNNSNDVNKEEDLNVEDHSCTSMDDKRQTATTNNSPHLHDNNIS